MTDAKSLSSLLLLLLLAACSSAENHGPDGMIVFSVITEHPPRLNEPFAIGGAVTTLDENSAIPRARVSCKIARDGGPFYSLSDNVQVNSIGRFTMNLMPWEMNATFVAVACSAPNAYAGYFTLTPEK